MGEIMWKKNIKYLLNFAGISLMIFYASVSYGIIARLPECKNVKEVILNVIVELSQTYLIYLIIITAINILFEREIEKRRDSKEFIFLTIINIILLILITSFFSNKFYNICCP
jgi:glucan phosphoethanolaminetransferase (alkaline phosphatase superfamily)